MRIGILGTGDAGKTLAGGFAAKGHDVMVGTRDPKSPKASEVQKAVAKAKVGSFADAAKHAELVVVATYGMATEEALHLAGPGNFAGKVVLDTTNPLSFSQQGVSLGIAGQDSLGERVQKALPKAHVVKAFNSVPSIVMVNPKFNGGPGDAFIAGNDAKAKETVTRLLKDFGWETVDVGGIEASRYLEGLAMTLILYSFPRNHWQVGFKLLNKK